MWSRDMPEDLSAAFTLVLGTGVKLVLLLYVLQLSEPLSAGSVQTARPCLSTHISASTVTTATRPC